ncbi:MAG: hypothetical protein ACKO1W_04405, partial [Microcystaceae cyanobacterium]
MVTNNQLFNEVLDITQSIWKAEPMRNIRMPDINKTAEPVEIRALWTDYGLRPNAGILAFLIQPISDKKNLE